VSCESVVNLWDLSCAITCARRLPVHGRLPWPRIPPCCGQRFCTGASAWSWPAGQNRPSSALPRHVLPSAAALALWRCCGVSLAQTEDLSVLSGKLPHCHSVDWDSVPVHGLCPRPNCDVPSPWPHLVQLAATRRFHAAGSVYNTISSVSKPPRVVSRNPLTSERPCGTSCRLRSQLMSACA
jgi:hypothetical protein